MHLLLGKRFSFQNYDGNTDVFISENLSPEDLLSPRSYSEDSVRTVPKAEVDSGERAHTHKTQTSENKHRKKANASPSDGLKAGRGISGPLTYSLALQPKPY